MSTPTGSIDKNSHGLIAKLVHFVQSLILPFVRPIDTGSFGRIVCTFLLAVSYYYSWRLSKDVPATLLTVLEAMLLYVFGSKVYTGYTSIRKAQITSSKSAVSSTDARDDASDSTSTDAAASK